MFKYFYYIIIIMITFLLYFKFSDLKFNRFFNIEMHL